MKRLAYIMLLGLLGVLIFTSCSRDDVYGSPQYVFEKHYDESQFIGKTKADILEQYGEFDKSFDNGTMYTGLYSLGTRDGVEYYCYVNFEDGICTSIEMGISPGG